MSVLRIESSTAGGGAVRRGYVLGPVVHSTGGIHVTLLSRHSCPDPGLATCKSSHYVSWVVYIWIKHGSTGRRLYVRPPTLSRTLEAHGDSARTIRG